MLMNQKMAIQSTHADIEVIRTIKDGNDAMKEMMKKVDVEAIEEIQEEMAEI